jgi:hypothetical protein
VSPKTIISSNDKKDKVQSSGSGLYLFWRLSDDLLIGKIILQKQQKNTPFLADIGKKRGVFLLLLQDYLADKEIVRQPPKKIKSRA